MDIGTVYDLHPSGRITACCGHAMFDTDAFDVADWKTDEKPLRKAVENARHNMIFWWVCGHGPKKILKEIGENVKTSHICDGCEYDRSI